MYGDVYNTTVNVNGERMYSSTFYPGRCCCGSGFGFGFGMNSCFGFGFSNPTGYLGIAAGCALGAAAVPFMPAIFKGIGKGVSWLGKSVIAPAATAAWKGICNAGEAIGKGVSSLWKKIFHKKSTAKTEKS